MLTHHRIQAVIRLYRNYMLKGRYTSRVPELRENVTPSTALLTNFKQQTRIPIFEIIRYKLVPFGPTPGIAPRKFELRRNETPDPKNRFLDLDSGTLEKPGSKQGGMKLDYEESTQNGSTTSAGQKGTEKSAKGSAQAPKDVLPAIPKSAPETSRHHTSIPPPGPKPNRGRDSDGSPAPPTLQNRRSAANRANSPAPTVRRRPPG